MLRVIAIVMMAGCPMRPGPVAQPYVDSEPVREPLAPPITLGPIAHPASAYNEPVDVTPSPESEAVFAGLKDFAHQGGVLIHDVRIDLAGNDLAEVVARGGAPSHASTEFVLHAHGVIEAVARVEIAHGTEPERIVAELAPKLRDALYFSNVRLGVGIAGDVVVVIVLYTAKVALAPVGRSVAGGFELAGELLPRPLLVTPWWLPVLNISKPRRFHDPRVRVTGHNTWTEPPVAVDANGAFRATITCGSGSGERWISIEATAETDPEQLALFPIYCRAVPPATFRIEPAANLIGILTPSDAERRLISILNRERTSARLELLRTDARVEAAARRYAELARIKGSKVRDMRMSDRLREWGIAPPVARWTVFHAEDLGRAAEYIANDPLERADLDSDDVTHLGVGIVEDSEHELYVALIYVPIPAQIDVIRARALILDRMRKVHSTVGNDDLLAEIAQRYAAGLAVGWRAEDLLPELDASVRGLGYGMRIPVVESAIDLDHVGEALVRSRAFGGLIGVGVAQSARDGPLLGQIWVVVL